jgi:hypothetical protein
MFDPRVLIPGSATELKCDELDMSICGNFQGSKIRYVRREANEAAHKFAKDDQHFISKKKERMDS